MIKDGRNFVNVPFAHMFYFKLADHDEELIERFVEACEKYLSGYKNQIHFSIGLRDLEIRRGVSALNFEISVNMIFKNKDAYIKYSKAKRHQEFITQVAGMSVERIVYDSYLLFSSANKSKKKSS